MKWIRDSVTTVTKTKRNDWDGDQSDHEKTRIPQPKAVGETKGDEPSNLRKKRGKARLRVREQMGTYDGWEESVFAISRWKAASCA